MGECRVTASAVISFVERLEDGAAALYTQMAVRYPQAEARLIGFAGECKKDKIFVVRTYQETITDALEACYAFEGLGLDDYVAQTTVPEEASYADALALAIAMEQKAVDFYTAVAEQSQALLATIPRAFRRNAQRHEKRMGVLEGMR